MHEFAISSEIVQTVLNAAEKNIVKKIVSIQLEIGELALINKEQVVFWIQELIKGTEAEGAKIKVKAIKARIKCASCGYQGGVKHEPGDPFQHLASYQCPKCGSFEIKAEKGRECTLRRIQVLK